MASDWIKIREDLPDDPAVHLMADHLGVTPNHVVGLLVRFWSWVGKHYENGHALVTPLYASRLVSEPHFHESLIRVGWLVPTDDGFFVPKWDRHNGESAKKRALAAERKRFSRSKVGHASVTEKCDKSVTREEKRREDRKTPATASPPRAPDEIWDSVASLWFNGKVGKPHESRVGKIVRDLKALGATPYEITLRVKRYGNEWPDAECSPEALVKHWERFAKSKKPATASTDEILAAQNSRKTPDPTPADRAAAEAAARAMIAKRLNKPTPAGASV